MTNFEHHTISLTASEHAQIQNSALRVFNEEISSLERTQRILFESGTNTAFANAVSMMFAARKVLVFGVGKSGLIGRKIAATLTSTGTRALFIHPVEALHGDIGIVESGDVAVLLSKSGTTAELLELLPTLRAFDIPMIGILGSMDSPLARLCTVVLNASVEREACPMNIAPMSSTTVALVVGDALASVLLELRGFTPERFASFHAAGQLGKNLNLRVADVMHGERDLPYVVHTASFREVLLEMTAKGLGCVCVVENYDSKRLVGLITDGDVRRTLQHYDHIALLTAEQVMTKHPLTTSPEALLGTALAQMERRDRQLNVLPVVLAESGVCVGVVRLHDIVRAGL